jgi:hypothetical protein
MPTDLKDVTNIFCLKHPERKYGIKMHIEKDRCGVSSVKLLKAAVRTDGLRLLGCQFDGNFLWARLLKSLNVRERHGPKTASSPLYNTDLFQ